MFAWFGKSGLDLFSVDPGRMVNLTQAGWVGYARAVQVVRIAGMATKNPYSFVLVWAFVLSGPGLVPGFAPARLGAEEPAPTPPASSVTRAASLVELGNTAEAIKVLDEVVAKDPSNIKALRLRGRVRESLGQVEAAMADYDRWVKLASEDSAAWQERGSARFKAGNVRGSIEDFDRAIELNPRLEQRHWQRGLSYYYDGRFREGAKQFELYQTYDANDVENVAWKFLCQAKVDGVEQAQRDMMPLDADDPRVPMMEIDALYRGKSQVDDVFRAARSGASAGDEQKYRLFYANLYVGLYYDAHGQPEKARELILAADQLKNDHYMWYVAHLHANRHPPVPAQVP